MYMYANILLAIGDSFLNVLKTRLLTRLARRIDVRKRMLLLAAWKHVHAHSVIKRAELATCSEFSATYLSVDNALNHVRTHDMLHD